MIEKNIFQSWYTKTVHPLVKAQIDYLRYINPEYKYWLYTDDDMDKFVNEHFTGVIANCYNRLNIIVAKVDFWRYLVLYKYGGVYLDMDSSINYPLRKLIRPDDEAIITAEGCPNTYVQWALIFKKEHPILKRTIELIVDNIQHNRHPHNVHAMTGPAVYTQAINDIHMKLFNNTIINHKGINNYTHITYKKNDISYRLYGIDYNKFMTFKHNAAKYLYKNKIHWKVEEKQKTVLK